MLCPSRQPRPASGVRGPAVPDVVGGADSPRAFTPHGVSRARPCGGPCHMPVPMRQWLPLCGGAAQLPTPGGGTSGCVGSLPTARSALVSERSAVCARLPSPGCVPRRGRAGLAESPRPSREWPAGPWQVVPFPPVSSVLHRLVQVAVGSLPRGGLAVMGTRACAPGRRPHALSAGLGPS